MITIIILILILYLGYLSSYVMAKKLPLLERLGLSPLLGIGLTTVIMFFYSWAGVKISSASVSLMVLSLVVVLRLTCLLFRRQIGLNPPNVFKIIKNLKWYEKLLCLSIFAVLLLSFVLATYFPVNVWDALALYDFRGKIIAETGYFVQIAGQFDYFAHYPLLTSLTHAVVYLSGGSNPQFTYPLYLASLSLIMFSGIRRFAKRPIALIATLVVVMTPQFFEHSTIAYANLPYAVYYVVGILYLFFSIREDRLDYLLLASVLIGLSTWARSAEPFWITGIIIVTIFSLYKKSLYPLFSYLPGFLIIQQPWRIYLASLYGGHYSTLGQFSYSANAVLNFITFQRIIEVAAYIYRNIILSWGPIILLFLIALLIDFKRALRGRNKIILLILTLNFLALFGGVYLFSVTINEWREIPDSARRMAMFFIPLLIFYIGISPISDRIQDKLTRN